MDDKYYATVDPLLTKEHQSSSPLRLYHRLHYTSVGSSCSPDRVQTIRIHGHFLHLLGRPGHP